MDLSLPRVATIGSLALALSAVSACGSGASTSGSSSGSSSASSDAPATEAGGPVATAEEAYAAWRASVLDDDVDAFDAVSVDGAWSDLGDPEDDAALLDELVTAVENGQLELPESPESIVGIDAMIADDPEGMDLEDIDPDEYFGMVEDEFDLEAVDGLALFTVPWDQGDGPGDVDTLFVRTDGAWLFFGMEPSD